MSVAVACALTAFITGSSAAQTGHEPHQSPPVPLPPADVPPVTDEDRRAAFPDVEGHAVHDTAVHYYVLFDQLEWQTDGDTNALSVDNKGWVGGDRNRFWFRAEGDVEAGDFDEVQAHALYGRMVARWWDLVAGVRQDFSPGPGKTWAAVGIQGLAPYWFEVEATGYVGESWRTHLRLEVEYELLLTNRLVLQPLVELEIYGKDIPENGIGAGFSSSDMGLRLRYEIRRELAPYVGITWGRKYGGTADLARADGDEASGARLAFGLRAWF
jgi:copper resistance protein B